MTTINKDTNSPLVTFALLAYNQEAYIREAIEGAFSQTYSPLEIILSDDSSCDQTFNIIRELASKYTGCHTVEINQNKANLGIAGHLSNIFRSAKGQFIVIAAGDDVSLPIRTETLVKAWQSSNRKAMSVYSAFTIIDAESRRVTNQWSQGIPRPPESVIEIVRAGSTGVYGCTQGVDRVLYEKFPPIPGYIVHEDEALPFRALLAGGKIVYLENELVKYRRHGENVFRSTHECDSQTERRKVILRGISREIDKYTAWLEDLQSHSSQLSDSAIVVSDLKQRKYQKEFALKLANASMYTALKLVFFEMFHGIAITSAARAFWTAHLSWRFFR